MENVTAGLNIDFDEEKSRKPTYLKWPPLKRYYVTKWEIFRSQPDVSQTRHQYENAKAMRKSRVYASIPFVGF